MELLLLVANTPVHQICSNTLLTVPFSCRNVSVAWDMHTALDDDLFEGH